MSDQNENAEIRTIFETMGIPFPTEETLKCKDFLDATEAMVKILEKFGLLFGVVIDDMEKNIKTLREIYEKNTELYKDLEVLVATEKAKSNVNVMLAALWLHREFNFVTLFFTYIISDRKGNYQDPHRQKTSIGFIIKEAYTNSLEKYYKWLGTNLVRVLLKSAPTHQEFTFVLANNRHNGSAKVLNDMKMYQKRMLICNNKLRQICKQHLESSEIWSIVD